MPFIIHKIYTVLHEAIFCTINVFQAITADFTLFHSRQIILRTSYMEYTCDNFVNVDNRINILLKRISDYEGYIIDTYNGSS